MTLSNAGSATLSVSNIVVSGDFSLAPGGTCTFSTSLGTGAVCSVAVTFSPTTSGPRDGSLTFTDNATGAPQIVALSGAGSDFSLVAATGSSTTTAVTPGQTATYNLSLMPAGGFNLPVTISCTGAPTLATCNVSPSVTPSGSSSTAVTVTVSTTARSSVPSQRRFGLPASWPRGLQVLTIFALLLVALGWLSWGAGARQRLRRQGDSSQGWIDGPGHAPCLRLDDGSLWGKQWQFGFDALESWYAHRHLSAYDHNDGHFWYDDVESQHSFDIERELKFRPYTSACRHRKAVEVLCPQECTKTRLWLSHLRRREDCRTRRRKEK